MAFVFTCRHTHLPSPLQNHASPAARELRPGLGPAMAPAGRSMPGTLFKYGPDALHTAFLSGRGPTPAPSPAAAWHAVLVGGLTDGLFAVPWAERLAERLAPLGWDLVQPLLRSSYSGFGVRSLDEDAADLALLAKHLAAAWGSEGLVLVGHSTGSQDAVRYAKRLRELDVPVPLLGVVLQAPVSDREGEAGKPETQKMLELAGAMVGEGRGEEILPLDACFNAPICARRYRSLYARGGDDDTFSSDVGDEQLREWVGHMEPYPTLVLLSGADEYVPPGYDTTGFARRLQAAMGPRCRAAVIEGADHALSAGEHAAAAVGEMEKFVESLAAASRPAPG